MKQRSRERPADTHGRPFTGAWIETMRSRSDEDMVFRRPFTGAWIETSARAALLEVWKVAPSRGRGLKLSKENR